MHLMEEMMCQMLLVLFVLLPCLDYLVAGYQLQFRLFRSCKRIQYLHLQCNPSHLHYLLWTAKLGGLQLHILLNLQDC